MGMAGAPFALYMDFIEPTSAFSLNYAVSALAMPIIGGSASWIGPVHRRGVAWRRAAGGECDRVIGIQRADRRCVADRVRGGGAARHSWSVAPAGRARWPNLMSPRAAASRRRQQALRRLHRADRGGFLPRRRRTLWDHRAQRFWQNHVDQLHLRRAAMRRGSDALRWHRHHPHADLPSRTPGHRAQFSDPASVLQLSVAGQNVQSHSSTPPKNQLRRMQALQGAGTGGA